MSKISIKNHENRWKKYWLFKLSCDFISQSSQTHLCITISKILSKSILSWARQFDLNLKHYFFSFRRNVLINTKFIIDKYKFISSNKTSQKAKEYKKFRELIFNLNIKRNEKSLWFHESLIDFSRLFTRIIKIRIIEKRKFNVNSFVIQ